MGGWLEIGTIALKLVAHQRGFHHTGFLIARLLIEKVGVAFRPPTESVAGLTELKFREDLNPDHHVQEKYLVIVEEVLASRSPESKVARKPTSQIAVEMHALRGWRRSVGWV
jgi:hypothetical protein